MNKIKTLTSLRFLFAIWVVFAHTGLDPYYGSVASNSEIFINLSQHGYLGVSFFFVLSGFILVISVKNEFKIREFYVNRFSRIYPTYLLAMSISLYIPYKYLVNKNYQISGIDIDGKVVFFVLIFVSIFLLQSWIAISGHLWNPPAWSLSAEFFFYLIFPIVYKKLIIINNSEKINKYLYVNILLLTILGFFIQFYLDKNSHFYIESFLIVNPILRC